MELKRIWQVSMGALLRRALDLGALTEWQHRTVTIEMSALGYRMAEPVEIPREQPRAVPALVRTLLENLPRELPSRPTELFRGFAKCRASGPASDFEIYRIDWTQET